MIDGFIMAADAPITKININVADALSLSIIRPSVACMINIDLLNLFNENGINVENYIKMC